MFTRLLTKLNPYMLYLKIGLIVLVFLSGAFVGCKMDEPDCSALETAKTELNIENSTLRSANAEYARVEAARNAQAAAEQATRKQQEEQATREVAAAQARSKTLAGKLAAIEAKQKAAALDPKCADVMELEVCGVLQ